MQYWIRRIAYVFMLSGTLIGARAGDRPTHTPVPITQDLAADAILATKERVPLLLIFTQDYCDYCEQLDREILNPYYNTGAFNGKAIPRRIKITSYATVTDFDGKPMDAKKLASQFKVYAMPSMLFVDAHGKELVERIVGINSMDFFAAYFDQSIEAAREKMRAQ